MPSRTAPALVKVVQAAVIKGRDSFGPWRMAVSETASTKCPVCNRQVHAVLKYWRVQFPLQVPVERTILKQTRRPIGVDCGCYAKMVRQVVHIADSLLKKGSPP